MKKHLAATHEPMPPLQPARWSTTVLICKECRKRSSGPRDLKPKAVASALKQAARGTTVRSRVMLTGCLGVCPKKALAILFVPRHGGAQIARVASVEQALEAATAMTVAAPAAAPALVQSGSAAVG
jgi:predicted metal-binding protein